MRTTLTIDDDVAFALKKAQDAEPRKPFKVMFNEILRRGLQSTARNAGTEFKVRSRPVGLRPDLNFDNVEEVLDILDGTHRR